MTETIPEKKTYSVEPYKRCPHCGKELHVKTTLQAILKAKDTI